MNAHRILPLALAALLPLIPACGDDDETGPGTSFSATLTGAAEVPPVETPATGTAIFTVSGTAITYTVNVANIANAVVAHIHVAARRCERPGALEPVRNRRAGTGMHQRHRSVGHRHQWNDSR